MKKSTRSFILGSIVAIGAAGGVYYAKKKGYLDNLEEFIKTRTDKYSRKRLNDDSDDELADLAENFTAPDDFGYTSYSSEDSEAEDRDYVSLDFDDKKEEIQEKLDEVKEEAKEVSGKLADALEEIVEDK